MRQPAAFSEPTEAVLAGLARMLDRGEVPVSIFGCPELYRAELASVFGSCWVYLAHASEIPHPGDYVLRVIGEDSVIVVRGDGGRVSVLLNACRHRGTTLCQTERGQVKRFRCPYHGWVFGLDGAWLGAPNKRDAYRELDATKWGLLRAPCVDEYQGLIFACLDPDAPTLASYLGGMCWYLDLCFDLEKQGMEVVGPPQRWRIDADWKTPSENFLADAYHVQTLHSSVEKVGVIPDMNKTVVNQFHVHFDDGHGAILAERPLPAPWGILGYPPMVEQHFTLDHLSEGQRAFLARYAVTTFTIFPNLSFIRVPGVAEAGGPPSVYTSLRQWQPAGPGRLEAWSWSLRWRCAPDWFNAQSYQAGIVSFGSSGIFEQDDSIAWTGAVRAARSVFGRSQGMTLNYQQGLKGMSDYGCRADGMGPGQVSTSVLGEAPQRAFYSRWLAELRRGAVRPDCSPLAESC